MRYEVGPRRSSPPPMTADLEGAPSGLDHSGADHGLAVDNVSANFATVPEPATIAALGLGILALRKRKPKL